MEAWQIVKRAIGGREAVIYVEGEEDLLVLPVILEAPNNAFVVYGQPSQGLVVVTVTPSKKREVADMMDRMSREESS